MTSVRPRLVSSRALPARADAAARVFTLVDNPECAMTELADAIGSDPAFASQVMAVANSAYYGLSGRVGTLRYAISVLGFQTIRALAVPIAAGLDGRNAVPRGFWEQAATAAAAAEIIAPTLGANPPEAFCAGLLHTIGAALLHQEHPLPGLCLPYPDESDEIHTRELEIYEIGHAAAAAQILRSWRFPDHLCALIETHHDVPLPDADPLTLSLHAARTLTDLALSDRPDVTRAHNTLQRLAESPLTPAQIDRLVDQSRDKAEALLSGLRAG